MPYLSVVDAFPFLSVLRVVTTSFLLEANTVNTIPSRGLPVSFSTFSIFSTPVK